MTSVSDAPAGGKPGGVTEPVGLLMPGLNGGNPLGFLAALGVLRALTRCTEDRSVRIVWRKAFNGWRPVIHAIGMDEENAVAALYNQCKEALKHGTLNMADDLTIKADDFREHLCELVLFEGRDTTEFACAFGCDAVRDNNKENIKDTALRTMSGAGHQHYLKTMRNLLEETTKEHIRKAVFEEWQYNDPLKNLSLRLDPFDEKKHALQWSNPSGDPMRAKMGNVIGANALAVLGIPLLSTAPSKNGLATTGFKGTLARDTYWTWPIWGHAVPIDVVRSLLSLREIQEPILFPWPLNNLGVVAVFRAQRLTVGKFRNFAPAKCLF